MEHKNKNTYTSCVFVLSMSIYSTIVDAKARGYMMMPQTEETLAGYLSPGGVIIIKESNSPHQAMQSNIFTGGESLSSSGSGWCCFAYYGGFAGMPG